VRGRGGRTATSRMHAIDGAGAARREACAGLNLTADLCGALRIVGVGGRRGAHRAAAPLPQAGWNPSQACAYRRNYQFKLLIIGYIAVILHLSPPSMPQGEAMGTCRPTSSHAS